MGRKPARGFSVVTRLFCITILAVACVRVTAAPLSPADRDTIQQQQQQLLEQNQRQRDELERSTPRPLNWPQQHRRCWQGVNRQRYFA